MDSVAKLEKPTTQPELHSLMVLCNIFIWFIPSFAYLAVPFNNVLRKNQMKFSLMEEKVGFGGCINKNGPHKLTSIGSTKKKRLIQTLYQWFRQEICALTPTETGRRESPPVWLWV